MESQVQCNYKTQTYDIYRVQLSVVSWYLQFEAQWLNNSLVFQVVSQC